MKGQQDLRADASKPAVHQINVQRPPPCRHMVLHAFYTEVSGHHLEILN